MAMPTLGQLSIPFKGLAMNNLKLAIVTKSFASNEDVVTVPANEPNPGFDKLTDDYLQLVGGGDVVVCW